MRRVLLALTFGVTGWLIAGSIGAEPVPGSLAFKQSGDREFAFDTGVLKGTLRSDGRSRGLSSVVHVPTGMRLDYGMGLMGHYRVFTKDRRFGSAAWDWPSEAQLMADGSVTVRWPESSEHPFGMSATYKWSKPTVLDLVTVVKAGTNNLARFESFLASYFAEPFTNSAVYIRRTGDGVAGELCAADSKYGKWLAFPRDDAATAMIQDGRWTIPPSPVDWVIMPRLASPMGVRRCPGNGLAAMVSSPGSDCFAVLTPEQHEGHRSLYLSLFGRDIAPGETARASAQLIVAVTAGEAEVIKAYQASEANGNE